MLLVLDLVPGSSIGPFTLGTRTAAQCQRIYSRFDSSCWVFHVSFLTASYAKYCLFVSSKEPNSSSSSANNAKPRLKMQVKALEEKV